MLVGQFDLDPHLILRTLDERNLVDDHHGSFDRIVRPVDGEGELVEAHVRPAVGADVGKHGSHVSW